MKVLLTGASGSGKTTLAKHISEKYSIPFINGSAKELWPKYGITTHRELIKACDDSAEFAQSFQYELLLHRQKQTMGIDSYVTDRTPLDNLLYYMLQVSHKVDTDANRTYIRACQDAFPAGDCHLVMCTTPRNGLEDDGMRINNVFYQMLCENTLLYLYQIYLQSSQFNDRMSMTVLQEWDWDKRVKTINNLLRTSAWEKIKGKLSL